MAEENHLRTFRRLLTDHQRQSYMIEYGGDVLIESIMHKDYFTANILLRDYMGYITSEYLDSALFVCSDFGLWDLHKAIQDHLAKLQKLNSFIITT